MNSRLIKANVIWSIVAQIVSIVCGFFVPRIVLSAFGSETNGLVASINQFLNYVTLLEGGVSGVAMAALYRPVQENDSAKINSVVHAIQRYFTRLGLICIGFTIVVAFLYPKFVDTDGGYWYLFLLTLVLGIRLVVQYCLSITYRLLLRADQKVFYVSITQVIVSLVHLGLVIIAVNIAHDVLIVYCVSGLAYLIQPLFFIVYVKKHYSIVHTGEYDKNALTQKWDGFGQNLAYFIHTNTDIVLLTLFSTLTNVSIYSVYLMVAYALQGLIITVSSAIAPSMGAILTKDDDAQSRALFIRYEFIIVFLAFVAYTCGIELVVPFISVYTKGVTDANYIQPVFATLIMAAEMLYCVRDPYVSVAYAAGHFKQTAKYAYLEAGINIVISIILVQILGITGVAIGTLVAMGLRTLLQVKYLGKAILYYSVKGFFKKVSIYTPITVGLVVASRFLVPSQMASYRQWVLYAVASFLVTTLVFVVINYVFYKKEFTIVVTSFAKRGKR